MANVLQMATVADVVTLIKSCHSDRRISTVLSLDRGTVAKYRRQLQAGESPTLLGESAQTKETEMKSWRVHFPGTLNKKSPQGFDVNPCGD